MAHLIDTTTGRAAVMVAGAAAWHRLGTNVQEAQTSGQALALAVLDWTVGKRPLHCLDDYGNVQPVPNHYALCRNDTGAALGVVGHQYRPLQNAEAFNFMDSLVGEHLARYETAGAIKGGRKVWMMMRLPKELRIPGTDDVQTPYALLTNSHDGTSCVQILATAVRVVCANTLTLALDTAGSTALKIRHKSSLRGRIDEARDRLGIVVNRLDQHQEEASAMARVSLSDAQAQDYFRSVFDLPVAQPRGRTAQPTLGNDGALLDSILGVGQDRSSLMSELLHGHQEQSTRQEKANERLLSQLMSNYHDKANSLPGIEGTVWAALNSVTEYVDHQMRTRGKDDADRADNRLQSQWFGAGAQVKQVAYTQALAMV